MIQKLNENDKEYEKYLAHKRLYNKGGTLVTNKLLEEMLEKRKWGVSSQQQASMGNFVKHFQCLVCERVANNVWFSSLGETMKRKQFAEMILDLQVSDLCRLMLVRTIMVVLLPSIL